MPATPKALQVGNAVPIEPHMHCETCKEAIRFVDGSWQHVAATKCVAVVVAWPEHPAASHDAA